jgi:hypothetical protein
MSELDKILAPGRYEWQMRLIVKGEPHRVSGASTITNSMTLGSVLDGVRVDFAKMRGIPAVHIAVESCGIEGPF